MLIEIYIMLFVISSALLMISFTDLKYLKNPVFSLLSAVLFAVLGFASFDIDIVDSGSVVTVHEPLLGLISAALVTIAIIQSIALFTSVGGR